MPVATSLLSAIVAYLKATSPVTALLSDADAITTDLSNWGEATPFVLVEGYDEVLPGASAEDEIAMLSICAYHNNLDDLRTLINAVMAAVDTPNINSLSTRTDQFVWTTGRTTGVMRDNCRIDREPLLGRNGEISYEASVQYEFWLTPSQ